MSIDLKILKRNPVGIRDDESKKMRAGRRIPFEKLTTEYGPTCRVETRRHGSPE